MGYGLPLQPPLDADQWPGLDLRDNRFSGWQRQLAALQLNVKLGFVYCALQVCREQRLGTVPPAALPFEIQLGRPLLGQPAGHIKWNPLLEHVSCIEGYVPSALVTSREQRLEKPPAATCVQIREPCEQMIKAALRH